MFRGSNDVHASPNRELTSSLTLKSTELAIFLKLFSGKQQISLKQINHFLTLRHIHGLEHASLKLINHPIKLIYMKLINTQPYCFLNPCHFTLISLSSYLLVSLISHPLIS